MYPPSFIFITVLEILIPDMCNSIFSPPHNTSFNYYISPIALTSKSTGPKLQINLQMQNKNYYGYYPTQAQNSAKR